MLLANYKPVSRMVTKETVITRPRFPVIDAHNHMGSQFGGGWDSKPVSALLDVLDESGVCAIVDLDGGWGEDIVQAHLEHFKRAAPERFWVFGGVDFFAWERMGERFPQWAAERLRQQAAWGIEGVKIWKPFGLQVKDPQGRVAAVDDLRLDIIWQTAGELGLPVTIHVADPVAFFYPVDETNERWEELQGHPDWQFPSPPFPSFESIVNGLANLAARHPATTFIGAHVGCYAENLGWVANVLDRCPNFHVDIAARIAELGRQPYTARNFFLKYADRILFGLDMASHPQEYRIYYRFLESDDEYFPYGAGAVPGQGRWNIYGLHLPDDVLEKVYLRNAERILRRKVKP